MDSTYGAPELAIIVAVFLFAGAVKGVVGLGLPTVAIGLLTALVGLSEGMVLMVIPSLVTNLWQALAGGALMTIVRRVWGLLLAVCIGAWVGVDLFGRSDTALLTALLGVMLIAYSVFGMVSPKLPSPGRHEGWLSPVLGAISGVLTGLTGTFFMPGVPYFQALGFSRDIMVQAMGVLFLVSTASLAVALGGHGRLDTEIGAVSALATVPALLGMVLGARLRRRLSEQRFQQALLAALLLLGSYIAVRSLAF
ncbi:MAG: sulfite exporter TauE/SafE family protein [Alphaproteobacteria bacterium]|nr:sulfite exporter TauE/SafE family protein [Alphaproteobacteria bacterium]MCZ6590388.1 sulfite exporter TauE/SafE family protein [Alphaproteobacteria bacterium]MCZ6837752.1 sulfite exporter TauE/SafE family protein [Alphaproteobacteria bacterium]